jgi:Methane oxygenase PmoA
MNAKFLLLLAIAIGLPFWGLADNQFTVERSDRAVTIKINGELFTEYVLGGEGNKPYFWPVIGPDGKAMTRAYPMRDVPGEKQDHPHHRSFYFGHQFINNFDTWHELATLEERAKGDEKKLATSLKTLAKTEVLKIQRAEALGDHAILETSSAYRDPDGKTMLEDDRTFTFRVDPASGARIVDAVLNFRGTAETVTLSDAKDAGFSLRVAHSMCVEAEKGGRIVTSEGHLDKEAWGKRAKWCDFNGPVDGQIMGVAILNHPSSFRYPTPWHARTYGLFTANPFGLKSVAQEASDGAVVLKKGETFTLRYRVIFHRGDEKAAEIEKAFATYAAEK